MQRRPDLNAVEIVAAYETGESAASIARRYQANIWSILQRLRAAGICVRTRVEQNERRLDLNDAQRESFVEIVDGLLLGDGSIDPKGCLRLEQSFARRHTEWLEDVRERFSAIGVESRIVPIAPSEKYIASEDRTIKSKGGYLLYTPCYVEMKEQRKRWYPTWDKRVPRDVSMTPLSLAYWFCGDGTYDQHGSLFFCTNGFLMAEVRRLAAALQRFGVEARMRRIPHREDEYGIAILKRNAALRLKETIEQFVPECFKYKFHHVQASRAGDHQRKLTPDQVRSIRERYSNGESSVTLGRDFGVRPTSILHAVKRKTHKHVE